MKPCGKRLTSLMLCFSFFVACASFAVDVKVPAKPLKAKLPVVKKKPNLVVAAMGWERELCQNVCPQIDRELHINRSRCRLRVRVANIGNGTAGRFSVQVRYTHWKGVATLQKVKNIGTGLPAKGHVSAQKDLYFDLGYYASDKPIIAIVDFHNQVSESNEADNTRSVVLH